MSRLKTSGECARRAANGESHCRVYGWCQGHRPAARERCPVLRIRARLRTARHCRCVLSVCAGAGGECTVHCRLAAEHAFVYVFSWSGMVDLLTTVPTFLEVGWPRRSVLSAAGACHADTGRDWSSSYETQLSPRRPCHSRRAVRLRLLAFRDVSAVTGLSRSIFRLLRIVRILRMYRVMSLGDSGVVQQVSLIFFIVSGRAVGVFLRRTRLATSNK